jgi:hypothetical protein
MVNRDSHLAECAWCRAFFAENNASTERHEGGGSGVIVWGEYTPASDKGDAG